MVKRMKVTGVNGSVIPLSEIHPITNKKEIVRVWTLYDEQRVLQNAPFHPQTGQRVTDIYNAYLVHHEGVFIEDAGHDWNFKKEGLSINSHAIGNNKPITLLIEWEESNSPTT